MGAPCWSYQQLIRVVKQEANAPCIARTYSQLEEDDQKDELLIQFISCCGKLFDAEKPNENRMCYWKQKQNGVERDFTTEDNSPPKQMPIPSL